MSVPKIIAGIVFNVTLFAVLLFVPAGTWHWWHAWVFLAVTVAVTAAAIFSMWPDSADLFSQRAKGVIQKGQPLWDRILVIVLLVSYLGQIIFIPLDVFRFHLMPITSVIVSLFGLSLYVAGWWIMTLAMKTNPFAVPVVRFQEERHQRVVDAGIYAIVRHPLYASALLFLVGLPLLLGSWIGLGLSVLFILGIAWRAVREERTLRAELTGYVDYAERVRYRFIPLVW